MSKQILLKQYRRIKYVNKQKQNSITSLMTCALMTCALLLTGCEPFPGDEKFYEIKIAPEKLRQVETLDLQEAKTEENHRIDANEAPPKELKLNLEQCRALTLENNLDLKVKLIEPTIYAEQVSEQEAAFEAAFFSNLRYSKTDTPRASELDQISGLQSERFSTGLGVEVPLRTGGDVTFNLADIRTETDAEGLEFNPYFGSNLSVSISQPLLRKDPQRPNIHNIRIAEYDRQIFEAQTKLEVIRVIAVVDRVYWRLYAARKELEVRKQQYDLAEALLEQARRFVAAGDKAQVEIIRTEAGVAQQLEAIIVADNSLRDRERELKRTINKAELEMQTPTVLIPTTEPDLVRYELEKQRLVATAIDNRMEMLELELQIAKDISTIDYLHNQALPLVTMDYTYNVNGLGASRNESFDLLFDKKFENHSAGIRLLLPLGNEAAKSRLHRAFYQRRRQLATRDNREALIEYEVLNAIDKLEANWQRILASRQRSILDGRLFEAEKRQFELGLGTSTDVLQAQTNFADAQSAEILALAEYQIALVDLAYATGTLLGAAKVQWEPIVPQSNIK
jgi:outer membrane protein TolC